MLVNNVGMLDGEEPIKVSGQFLKDMFFIDPLKSEFTYLGSIVVCSILEGARLTAILAPPKQGLSNYSRNPLHIIHTYVCIADGLIYNLNI